MPVYKLAWGVKFFWRETFKLLNSTKDSVTSPSLKNFLIGGIWKDRQIHQLRRKCGYALRNGLPTNLSRVESPETKIVSNKFREHAFSQNLGFASIDA